MAKGLVMQSASSLKRAHIRDDLMVLTRKFQTNDLRFYFWGRLKQQSGRALSLGLGSRTLAQIMPFWACGFLFNTETLVFSINLLRSTFHFC